MATYNPLANALKVTFDSWAKKNIKYKNLYLSLPKEIVETIVWTALEEIKNYNPVCYHLWWQTNHPRFRKKFKQMHMAIVHEIMFVFLSDLTRGKLRHEAAETKEKTKRNKKPNNNTKTTSRKKEPITFDLSEA